MQQGGQYGGGVYSAPSMPPEHGSLHYDGSPNYASSPGSAPSAPAYAQAPSSYYQSVPSNQPSVSSYNSISNAPFIEQNSAAPFPKSSNSYASANPNSSFQDLSSVMGSHNNAYPPSYAPVLPFQGLDSSYERSSEVGGGSFDPSLQQQRNHFGNPGYGAAPQSSSGYESYGQGNGGYVTQGEQGYAGGIFNQRTAYEKTGYDQDAGYGKTGYDPGTGYGNAGYGGTDLGSYGARTEDDRNFDMGSVSDVYAYDGGGGEPYGSRGTGGSSWLVGSSGSLGGFNSSSNTSGSNAKIARPTPKVENNAEMGGIQKFRVKLLPEPTSAESVKDVICQIGLDGVRMVDPSTSRTLRIYPLDNITKWEVKQPSVFTFWAKSAVDVDQRVIQLQSSNATTTAILDTLTAACVQLCEMKDGPSDAIDSTAGAGTSAPSVKKGSVMDWVALRARPTTIEEKQHWVPDEAVSKCNSCDSEFGAFYRRHHCRNCGDIFCDKCTRGRIPLSNEDSQPVRVCDRCLAEITQRMENNLKTVSKVSTPQRTHEDLAKKLQEELERNQAGRKQTLVRPTTNGNGNSGQTSLFKCSKCGEITLVTGNSRGCLSCGADSGNVSTTTNTSASFVGSTVPHGPPHLWSSDAAKSDKAGPRTREVACPTCTVHLQVQVPDFGTETVECGVCQHPFLVSA